MPENTTHTPEQIADIEERAEDNRLTLALLKHQRRKDVARMRTELAEYEAEQPEHVVAMKFTADVSDAKAAILELAAVQKKAAQEQLADIERVKAAQEQLADIEHVNAALEKSITMQCTGDSEGMLEAGDGCSIERLEGTLEPRQAAWYLRRKGPDRAWELVMALERGRAEWDYSCSSYLDDSFARAINYVAHFANGRGAASRRSWTAARASSRSSSSARDRREPRQG